MNKVWITYATGCLAVALVLSACASADIRRRSGAREYPIPDVSGDVKGDFKLVRDAMRDVLRDSPVEIYTRDRRGLFVAFSDMGRAFLTPRRVRLVITLQPVSEDRVRIIIKTFPEAYTVQLLTKPAWRPASFGNNVLAKKILDSLQTRVSKTEQ